MKQDLEVTGIVEGGAEFMLVMLGVIGVVGRELGAIGVTGTGRREVDVTGVMGIVE